MFIKLHDVYGNSFLIKKQDIQLVSISYEGFCYIETERYKEGEWLKVRESMEELERLLIGE